MDTHMVWVLLLDLEIADHGHLKCGVYALIAYAKDCHVP